MLELPLHSLDLEAVTSDLQSLYDSGYRSLAIVFAHSYTFPSHELQIGALARSLGFMHVSESSQLLPMIKLVPRGVSSTADAYLTPVLRRYLDGFFSGFDEKLRDGRMGSPRVEFMGSDGGLLDLAHFSGLKSILSGPAGGVVGYALTSWDEQEKKPIIGLVPSENFFLDPITLKMGYQDRRRWDIDRCVAICGPV
jgi:5-oxoprolinase (ATP-hydrolysing)